MSPGNSVYFTVLGHVRLFRDGEELALGPGQERAVLALLLARAGQPVPIPTLIDALWGDEPPASAMNVIQRSVGRIRHLLEPDLPRRASGQWLLRDGNSYRLVLRDHESDLLRFRALIRRARAATDPAEATALQTEALGLWDGACAAGVETTLGASTMFRAVDAERSQIAIQTAEVAAHGEPSYDLLRVLRTAVAADPLNEMLHAGVTRCLAAAGHRAEALGLLHGVRQRLADELGIGPGPALQAAHLQVLRSDHNYVDVRPAAKVRPAMLPPEPTLFAGRSAEFEQLDAGAIDRPDATTVVVSGPSGVGKTTLAVRWARANAHRFPDGQLFVDLRGFGPERRPVSASDALSTLLVALGIPAESVPPTCDERIALYRSVLERRRVLLIADNVRDEKHVRPLLPPGPGSVTLVTGRSSLPELAAVPLALDVFPLAEARDFLLRRLSSPVTAFDQAAADEIVATCGGLPLALSVVAARLQADPSLALRAVADQMRSSASRLGPFEDGDDGVRTTLRWSYEALSPLAQRAFRLAAVHRGFEAPLELMASICDFSMPDMDRVVEEICAVRLLDQPSPGRYQAHDLTCSFSVEMCKEGEDDESRRDARGRLLGCYRASLAAATEALIREAGGGRDAHPPEPGVVAMTFDAPRQARDWFAVERPQIVLTLDDLGKHQPGEWESGQQAVLADG